tara:strand:- start:347 stop:721 length:375 start_codon:yes stop_codon:yes gene_type:complete
MKKIIAGKTITFTFDGGVTPLVFNATRAATANREYAEMHGWQARLGDVAAIPRKQPDGTIITVTEQMRRDAIAPLVEHYEGGASNWEIKRTSPQLPALLELARKLGKTYAEVEEMLVADALAKM